MRNLIKKVLREELDMYADEKEADKFKAVDGMLSIYNRLYTLSYSILNITIHKVIVEKNGDIKLDASAMGMSRQTNTVGKSNIDKVVSAVEKGQREIKVKNIEGQEFTLTKEN